jgi:hypothetical protein
MRKIRILLAVIFLAGSIRTVNAQFVGFVSAPILETISSNSFVEQVIYYAQSIGQMVQSGVNSYNQLQNMIKMSELAYQNLRGIVEIESWDDFMSWYNRQLYLERQVERRFSNMGMSIGGKTYKFSDMEDMKNVQGALKSTYVDYWDNEFTPEQRREMWTNLGLSPANYAYIQTWQEREKQLAALALTKLDVINEDNMAAAGQQNEINEQLKADQNKPDDQKLGEKDLAKLSLQVQMDTNKATRQMLYDQAEADARRVAAERLNDVPPNPPHLSDSWGKSFFSPIVEGE